jgi:hypothetical protein
MSVSLIEQPRDRLLYPILFRADRRKQNALVRAGWDPPRFTWHELDGSPGTVAGEIRETLQAA